MRDGERGWFPANCATQITNRTAMESNIQRMERLRKETDVWQDHRMDVCARVSQQTRDMLQELFLVLFELAFVKIHVWIHKKLFKNVKLTRYQITFKNHLV